jgi:peptide deformylase
MRNTLDKNNGFYKSNTLGISANQIGYDYRIMLVSKYPGKIGNKFFDVMINPNILHLSEEQNIFWEGCISDEK